MAVRSRHLIALLTALALIAGACGGDDEGDGDGAAGGDQEQPSEAAPDPNAILRFGVMQAVSLDPVKQSTPCEVTQARLIYDTLTQFDRDNQLQPMLAESWELDSPTSVTMTLRDDVTFQDGTPFDAEAVKFNLDRVLTGPDSNIQGLVWMLESVDVVDEHTVRLTMSQPAAGPLLAALADRPGMMVSPTAYQAAGSQDAFNQAPVGSGKFRVEGTWRPAETLSVRAWDGYWDTETPPLGGIDMTNVGADARVNALNSGSMDLVTLDATAQIPGVEGQPNTVVKVDAPPVPQTRMFLLNATAPPLDDVRVRQAIAHALDREAIAEVMSDGEQEAIFQWFPEGSVAYNDDLDDLYSYDPERAEELLTEAGFPDGFDLPAVIGSTATSYIQQGELIQEMLGDVGINMSLDRIETAQMVPTVFTGGPDGNGTAVAVPWGANLTPDPDGFFRRLFLEEGTSNNGGDEVPGIRELLDDAAASLDDDERTELYAEASRLAVEGVYEGIPLFYVAATMAHKDYVGGLVQAETGCPASFLRDLYITEGRVPATEE